MTRDELLAAVPVHEYEGDTSTSQRFRSRGAISFGRHSTAPNAQRLTASSVRPTHGTGNAGPIAVGTADKGQKGCSHD